MPRYTGKQRMLAPDVGALFIVPSQPPGINGQSRYRLTSWLREMDPPKPGVNWIDEILYEGQQTIQGKKLVHCTRNEASHVSGTGVCGCIVSIDKIKVVGRVPWSKELIAEERRRALLSVGTPVF